MAIPLQIHRLALIQAIVRNYLLQLSLRKCDHQGQDHMVKNTKRIKEQYIMQQAKFQVMSHRRTQ